METSAPGRRSSHIWPLLCRVWTERQPVAMAQEYRPDTKPGIELAQFSGWHHLYM